jgi:hypothetical protein
VSLFPWLDSFGPTAEEVRGEVWRLGVRYHGEPLAGARQELAAQGLAPARTALLRACVRALKKG